VSRLEERVSSLELGCDDETGEPEEVVKLADAYNAGRDEILDALLPVIELALKQDKAEAEYHLRKAGLVGGGELSAAERLVV
jgi:hypothetical protein